MRSEAEIQMDKSIAQEQKKRPPRRRATAMTEKVTLKAIAKFPAKLTKLSDEELKTKIKENPHLSVRPFEVWRSRFWVVQLYRTDDDRVRISIQRARCSAWIRRSKRDKRTISWDDIQWIKSEIGMGDLWAVEVYPPDDEVVNVAYMRHIFIVGSEELPFDRVL